MNDEFVPCRPTCQTCGPGNYSGGGAMRWTPDMPAFRPGSSVEPHRPVPAVIRAMVARGAVLDEIAHLTTTNGAAP